MSPISFPILRAGTVLSANSSSPTWSDAFLVGDAVGADTLLTVTAPGAGPITEISFVWQWSDKTGALWSYVLAADNTKYVVPVNVTGLTPNYPAGAHIETRGYQMRVGFWASAGSPTSSAAGATVTVY